MVMAYPQRPTKLCFTPSVFLYACMHYILNTDIDSLDVFCTCNTSDTVITYGCAQSSRLRLLECVCQHIVSNYHYTIRRPIMPPDKTPLV